jgi:hypothetical protein
MLKAAVYANDRLGLMFPKGHDCGLPPAWGADFLAKYMKLCRTKTKRKRLG